MSAEDDNIERYRVYGENVTLLSRKLINLVNESSSKIKSVQFTYSKEIIGKSGLPLYVDIKIENDNERILDER